MRPDIVAKWVANAPLEMLEQHVANLGKYYAIAIDIGTKDGLIAVEQGTARGDDHACASRTTTRSTTAITPTRCASGSS